MIETLSVSNSIVQLVYTECHEQVFGDYSALYKVLAAFYETLRLIRAYLLFLLARYRILIWQLAAGSVMIRKTTTDTVLKVPVAFDSDKTEDRFLPKGSIVRFANLL